MKKHSRFQRLSFPVQFPGQFVEKLGNRYRKHKQALTQLRCELCDKAFKSTSRFLRLCRSCQNSGELAFL